MAAVMSPLAPALGRLAAPPRDGAFEQIRLALVDTLVAAHGEGQLDGGAWLAAWHGAVTAIRDQVVADARARLARAAARSRCPDGRLQALLPDDDAADRLLQRLLAEGIPLEELESEPVTAESTRRRGAALEAAWDAAAELATRVAAEHRLAAERVLAWRWPWRPLVIAASLVVLLASIVAAMLGGLLPSPERFEPVIDWFWRLPWP